MFAERLKKERINRNLTQAELAKKLDLTQQAIGKWEKGIAEPDIQTLKKLSLVLGCDIRYLLGTTNNPLPVEKASPETSTKEALLIAIRNMLGREPTEDELRKFLDMTKVFFEVQD